MEYHGKRYLYNFLKERYDLSAILDYDRPVKMADFNYAKRRGFEWLETAFKEIQLTSPCRDVIYVTINEIDDETGKKTQIEYSKYINGVLNYQTKNGKTTIMSGQPYKAAVI